MVVTMVDGGWNDAVTASSFPLSHVRALPPPASPAYSSFPFFFGSGSS